MFNRFTLRAAFVSTSLALATACGQVPSDPTAHTTASAAQDKDAVSVQLLALNDFHGALETNSGNTISVRDATNTPRNVPAGGAAYLSTLVQNLRAQNENTVTVSAGDLVGASPLLSSLFHDEPTIEAFNLIGLDYHAVGNHEFDEGVTELVRLQEGGCHPVDGCQDGDDFAGASFRFLAANTIRENEHTLFPPYKVRSFAGARVAFIGLTLEDTPSVVTQAGVAGVRFADEADTANALVQYLQGFGVEAFVVIVHQGGAQTGGFDDCTNLSGPIVDIAQRLAPAVDVVVSAHTHNAYRCDGAKEIAGKIVTSAASNGRLLTQINLSVDRETGHVRAKSARNHIVQNAAVAQLPNMVPLAADPAVVALLDKYRAIVTPLANRQVGSITADIRRTLLPNGSRDETRESAIGDVIADAQLAATQNAGAAVAFMNPGGIRADLLLNADPNNGGAVNGNITYSELFAVQPFGNYVVTMTLTGAQLRALLEQQWAPPPQLATGRVLQISAGFTYAYSASAPYLNKVDPASMKVNGVTVDPNGSYRVTVNSFLADGGDAFSVLKQGTERVVGVIDLDALEAYFAASSPVAPGPQNRITVLP